MIGKVTHIKFFPVWRITSISNNRISCRRCNSTIILSIAAHVNIPVIPLFRSIKKLVVFLRAVGVWGMVIYPCRAPSVFDYVKVLILPQAAIANCDNSMVEIFGTTLGIVINTSGVKLKRTLWRVDTNRNRTGISKGSSQCSFISLCYAHWSLAISDHFTLVVLARLLDV